MAAGPKWNFSPDVENGLDPVWPRNYETYSEDPLVCGKFGVANIIGQQRSADGSDFAGDDKLVACAKHFIGYPAPYTGKDRVDAWIPDHYLREYFVPPFQMAIKDGNVGTIMINSGSVNGVPSHASHEQLTTLVKEEFGFEGFLITDWEDIKKLVTWHKVAADEKEATKMAINAGVDMSMVPVDTSFHPLLVELVNEGEVSMDRIDDAVRRILRVKKWAGDLNFKTAEEKEAQRIRREELAQTIGSPEHRQIALEATRETMILLKNGATSHERLGCYWEQDGDNREFTFKALDLVTNMTPKLCVDSCAGHGYRYAAIFPTQCYCNDSYGQYGMGDDSACHTPCAGDATEYCGNDLAKELYEVGTPLLPLNLGDGQKIAVVGPLGDSMKDQCGGWTIHWQGAIDDDEFYFGNTICKEMTERLGEANVSCAPGCSFFERSDAQLAAARLAALNSDIIILAIGEWNQAEGWGNYNHHEITDPQRELYNEMKATGKPIIVALMQARKWILNEIFEADAIWDLGLPCVEGGEAFADLLYGDINPSARLSFTYPRNNGDILPYFRKPVSYYTQGTDVSFHNPLWEFGFGLSYTRFRVSSILLRYSDIEIGSDQTLSIRVTVNNEGTVDGKVPVLVFLEQAVRYPVAPDIKRLVAFDKQFIPAGSSVAVGFEITQQELGAYYDMNRWELQPGMFMIHVMDATAQFMVRAPTALYQKRIHPWPTAACDDQLTCDTAIIAYGGADCGSQTNPCPIMMGGVTGAAEGGECGAVWELSDNMEGNTTYVRVASFVGNGVPDDIYLEQTAFEAMYCPRKCIGPLETVCVPIYNICSEGMTEAVDTCACKCPDEESNGPFVEGCELQAECRNPTVVPGPASDTEFYVVVEAQYTGEISTASLGVSRPVASGAYGISLLLLWAVVQLS
eukprot:GHVP01014100.1.p1 GENE.GHVP01014100.1~~GHVP01014100.1.p1  ORF type:complete len:967 (-),score=165.22 GHVP01014100.1:121-2859(-)